jgi:hypothetical protein
MNLKERGVRIMSNGKTLNRGWLWVRRILSVIAGFAAILVLSVVTDIVLEQTGVFPPPDRGLFDTGLLLIAIAYRSVYSVAGCVIAAKLAPDHPFRHALALGVVGIIISSLGAVAAQALAPV